MNLLFLTSLLTSATLCTADFASTTRISRRHASSLFRSAPLPFSAIYVRGGSVAATSPFEVDVSTMVEAKTLKDGTVFPLTLTASSSASRADAAEWVKANRDRIVEDLLPLHGAVVLRGLDVPDSEVFSKIVHSLGLEEQVRELSS